MGGRPHPDRILANDTVAPFVAGVAGISVFVVGAAAPIIAAFVV